MLTKMEESLTFSPLWGRGGSLFLGDVIAAQKPFVSLKRAPKQILCSLLNSDMLDIASNSMLKSSCTISDTSGAATRKWLQAP